MPVVDIYPDALSSGNTIDGTAIHLGGTGGSTWNVIRSSVVNGYLVGYNEIMNQVGVVRHDINASLFERLTKSYFSFDFSPYAGKYINSIAFYNYFKDKNIQGEESGIRLVRWTASNQLGGWNSIEENDWKWDTGQNYGLYSTFLHGTYTKSYMTTIQPDQLTVTLLSRTQLQPFLGYIFGMAMVMECDYQNNGDLAPPGLAIETIYNFWSVEEYGNKRPYIKLDYSDTPPAPVDSQIIMLV